MGLFGRQAASSPSAVLYHYYQDIQMEEEEVEESPILARIGIHAQLSGTRSVKLLSTCCHSAGDS